MVTDGEHRVTFEVEENLVDRLDDWLMEVKLEGVIPRDIPQRCMEHIADDPTLILEGLDSELFSVATGPVRYSCMGSPSGFATSKRSSGWYIEVSQTRGDSETKRRPRPRADT